MNDFTGWFLQNEKWNSVFHSSATHGEFSKYKSLYHVSLGFNVHDTVMKELIDAQFEIAQTAMASNHLWISRL